MTMPLLLVILAAVAPALGLLYFIYNKDRLQREPVPELLKAFGYGMLSVFASLLVSGPLMALGIVPALAETAGQHLRVAFLGAAIPEELAKFALLMLFLRRCRYFDEYTDGIVYAACVGLGFAALENIMYLFQNFENWAAVGAMRALFSVPGHFCFAVVMGYYYAKASFDHPSERVRNLCLAILLPILLHGCFDALLMVSSVSAAAVALIALFGGLYFYMIKTSRKMIGKLLSKDQAVQDAAQQAALDAALDAARQDALDAALDAARQAGIDAFQTSLDGSGSDGARPGDLPSASSAGDSPSAFGSDEFPSALEKDEC